MLGVSNTQCLSTFYDVLGIYDRVLEHPVSVMCGVQMYTYRMHCVSPTWYMILFVDADIMHAWFDIAFFSW